MSQPTRIAVVGLGERGLPLAVLAAEAGCQVIGYDPDKRRISGLVTGHSHVPSVPNDRLADAMGTGRFRASETEQDLRRFDAVILAVGDHGTAGETIDLDLDALHLGRDDIPADALDAVAATLEPGSVAVVVAGSRHETDGDDHRALVTALEAGSGLVAGRDFEVARWALLADRTIGERETWAMTALGTGPAPRARSLFERLWSGHAGSRSDDEGPLDTPLDPGFDTTLDPLSDAADHPEAAALALRIRRHVVAMTSRGGSSHVGSGLSIADILAVLYERILDVDPADPERPDRDRFILSKGHAGAAVYAVLAERGFFDPAVLEHHYQNGSNLSGHVSHKDVPGVELSTGSLGHGLGVGAGLAYAAKLDEASWRTYVLLSDGECDEGSIWEAAMFAGHHRLDNLTAIVDYNKIQSLASVSDTLELEPFADKWRAFGWTVRETDGHRYGPLTDALQPDRLGTGPSVVIAHTTKGKGVSFMEHAVLWHYRSPQDEEYDAAVAELDAIEATYREAGICATSSSAS